MKIEGENNSVDISTSAKLNNVEITIKGNNNRIIISNNDLLFNLNIQMLGDNHLFKIEPCSILRGGIIEFEDIGNSLLIGSHTEIHYNFYATLCEKNKSIIIGNNCLFSNTVRMWVADSHPIIDMNTEKLLNPGKDIILNDRIWICEYVRILKGVILGSDSVIGAGSVVTAHTYPDHCVIAGNPAKVIKTNISWKHLRILD